MNRLIKYLMMTSLLFVPNVFAAKIKNIANVIGVRDNQLMGYGIVVGLNKTGDKNDKMINQISNALGMTDLGVDLFGEKASTNANQANNQVPKFENSAAVVVTAKLPPFSKQGDKIDIMVSSIGDAKSLEGGTLLLTQLKAIDGKVYALAQGNVATGGFNTDGGGGGKGQKNHTTNAKLISGATVEREVPLKLAELNSIKLSLKEKNFQNAVKIQNAVNRYFNNNNIASAIDGSTLNLSKKDLNMSIVEFISSVEMIEINQELDINKIIIDEKTGTIIAGANIKIEPIMITHNNITIKLRDKNEKDPDVEELKIGDGTVITQNESLKSGKDVKGDFVIKSEKGNLTIANLARSLQRLGAEPKDIIAIFEAIKKSGAITADIEII
jgi:flagellar P-ring protein precursor FlgI